MRKWMPRHGKEAEERGFLTVLCVSGNDLFCFSEGTRIGRESIRIQNCRGCYFAVRQRMYHAAACTLYEEPAIKQPAAT